MVMFIIFASNVLCKKYAKCNAKLDVSVCTSADQEAANATAKKCRDIPVCRKQFNITYVELEPYSTLLVSDLLSTCCGPCVNSTEVHKLTKISQMSEAVMRESHFVFPVLGRPDMVSLYGYRFIPLIETPNVYYITVKQHNLIQKLIVECLNMWPLMIICILMVMISGFLCWLTETWSNRDEFPRTFIKGWFEGIWWAFISMTTVGYGDKAPKTIAARFFSIIWIVVGITTFSLVTAMLTSEISAANSLPPPTMKDANVGAIRHRIYEAILIAHQGGTLVDVKANLADGIRQLINMLENKEIDGFVLDRYSLMSFYSHYENHERYKKDIHYLRTKSLLTELQHTEAFLYGVLVKNVEDYEFLEDYMKSNRDVINTCTNLFLNSYSRQVRVYQEKISLFSTKGQMFWPSFVICISIIVIICIFGVIYGYSMKKSHNSKDTKSYGNGVLLK